MEINLGEKYKILHGNIVKLLLSAIGCLILSILLTAMVNPTMLDVIFKALGIDIAVNTGGEALPSVVHYLVIAIDVALLFGFLYFILAMFMNKFKMYENAIIIKRPFHTETIAISSISSVGSLRKTQTWAMIPVSVADEFTFNLSGEGVKSTMVFVKSGQYLGLKNALLAYDKKYNKGWF